jgi:hypothetical protein
MATEGILRHNSFNNDKEFMETNYILTTKAAYAS